MPPTPSASNRTPNAAEAKSGGQKTAGDIRQQRRAAGKRSGKAFTLNGAAGAGRLPEKPHDDGTPQDDLTRVDSSALQELFTHARASEGQGRKGFVRDMADHAAVFIPRGGAAGKVLIVTFDHYGSIHDPAPRMPWKYPLWEGMGLSHLAIVNKVNTWFRDPDLYDLFDEFRGGDMFDGWDRVVFAGVSMGGYAAAAYSSAAPGSHVLGFAPQAVPVERFMSDLENDPGRPYYSAPEQIAQAGSRAIFLILTWGGTPAMRRRFAGRTPM